MTEPEDQRIARYTDAGCHKSLDRIEEEIIRAAIADCDGSVSGAASLLGVGRSTLYRRMRDWDARDFAGLMGTINEYEFLHGE